MKSVLRKKMVFVGQRFINKDSERSNKKTWTKNGNKTDKLKDQSDENNIKSDKHVSIEHYHMKNTKKSLETEICKDYAGTSNTNKEGEKLADFYKALDLISVKNINKNIEESQDSCDVKFQKVNLENVSNRIKQPSEQETCQSKEPFDLKKELSKNNQISLKNTDDNHHVNTEDAFTDDTLKTKVTTLGDIIADRITRICNENIETTGLRPQQIESNTYRNNQNDSITFKPKDCCNRTLNSNANLTKHLDNEINENTSINSDNSNDSQPDLVINEDSPRIGSPLNDISENSGIKPLPPPIIRHHLVDIHGLAIFLRDATRCLSCRSAGSLYITGAVSHPTDSSAIGTKTYPVVTKFTITCQKCRFLTQQELVRPSDVIPPTNNFCNKNQNVSGSNLTELPKGHQKSPEKKPNKLKKQKVDKDVSQEICKTTLNSMVKLPDVANKLPNANIWTKSIPTCQIPSTTVHWLPEKEKNKGMLFYLGNYDSLLMLKSFY